MTKFVHKKKMYKSVSKTRLEGDKTGERNQDKGVRFNNLTP